MTVPFNSNELESALDGLLSTYEEPGGKELIASLGSTVLAICEVAKRGDRAEALRSLSEFDPATISVFLI